MPLPIVPILLGGASLIAGLMGTKKAIDGKRNYDDARNIVDIAKAEFESTCKRFKKAQSKVSSSLEELGRLRLKSEDIYMARFIDALKSVNNAEYKNIEIGNTGVHFALPDLQEIQLSIYQAKDLLKDGVGAVSSGVLVGIGAGGLATSIGTVAGTGTAIGTLTGVAATNATLAWLGGGSLAAGGMGMAGGTLVLGGAVAGPLLAVMGYSFASKSEIALTEAYEEEARISELIENVENGTALLISIRERSEEMQTVIEELSCRFSDILIACEYMIKNKKSLNNLAEKEWGSAGLIKKIFRKITGEKPFDHLYFEHFTQNEKDLYSQLIIIGSALYQIIKVKILDDAGLVTTDSELVIDTSRTILKGDI